MTRRSAPVLGANLTGACVVNRYWFAPLIVGAVACGLPGIALIGGSTTAIVGWVIVVAAMGMVAAAIIVRRRGPRPGAKPWLGWPVVLVAVVALFITTRQVNLLLLDAGISASNGMTRQAKLDVAAQMKDPTSVLFTNVKEGVSVVCGMANGKNSFGAYSGPERFLWTSSDGARLESGLNSTGFPHVDEMKRCWFDQEWNRCQGIAAGTASDCTASITSN